MLSYIHSLPSSTREYRNLNIGGSDQRQACCVLLSQFERFNSCNYKNIELVWRKSPSRKKQEPLSNFTIRCPTGKTKKNTKLVHQVPLTKTREQPSNLFWTRDAKHWKTRSLFPCCSQQEASVELRVVVTDPGFYLFMRSRPWHEMQNGWF